MKIAETLTSIFAESLPRDHLAQIHNRIPVSAADCKKDASDEKIFADEHQQPNKKARVETNKNTVAAVAPQLQHQNDSPFVQFIDQHPEVFLSSVVHSFLDLRDVHLFSGCCSSARKVCNTEIKLERIFSEFCILKRYADDVHENTKSKPDENANVTWDDTVIRVMLQAHTQLRMAYGVHEIHPLHAAMIGEALFCCLAQHPYSTICEFWETPEPPKCSKTIRLVDLWSQYPCDGGKSHAQQMANSFIVGQYTEYIKGDQGSSFITGLREGRLPFVHVFLWAQEEGTQEMGVWLPEQNKSGGSSSLDDDTTYSVFSLNYQDAASEDDEDDERKSIDNCTSLAQAFCQHATYCSGICDWTQLKRAAWLRNHRLAPFDCDENGNWHRLLDAAGELLDDTKNKPSMKEEEDDGEEDFPVEVLDYFRVYALDDEDTKALAVNYLNQAHSAAQASDYV